MRKDNIDKEAKEDMTKGVKLTPFSSSLLDVGSQQSFHRDKCRGLDVYKPNFSSTRQCDRVIIDIF